MWDLAVLHVAVWVFSRWFSFLFQSKIMHIRLIGDSKFPPWCGFDLIVSFCVSVHIEHQNNHFTCKVRVKM